MLNTFDQVVAKYESIKPVNGAQTPATLDVRPIDDRRRKWERIVKIDESCYALSDGLYDYGNVNESANSYAISDEDIAAYAPILWERRTDGDYITICNGVKGSVPQSRFRFLQNYLPVPMAFEINNGKHYVRCDGERYFLPKTTGRPNNCYNRDVPEDNGKTRLEFYQEKKFRFKLSGDRIYPDKVAVNTSKKKKYKQEIAAFYKWCITMAPLLRPEMREVANGQLQVAIGDDAPFIEAVAEAINGYPRELLENGMFKVPYKVRHNLRSRHYPYPTALVTDVEDYILNVICDDEHEQRANLASCLLNYMEYYNEYEKLTNGYTGSKWEVIDGKMRSTPKWIPPVEGADRDRLITRTRARFTRAINKLCGFTVMKKGD